MGLLTAKHRELLQALHGGVDRVNLRREALHFITVLDSAAAESSPELSNSALTFMRDYWRGITRGLTLAMQAPPKPAGLPRLDDFVADQFERSNPARSADPRDKKSGVPDSPASINDELDKALELLEENGLSVARERLAASIY
ncbi:MAG: hypothetical protein AAGB26_06870 [Planctomycetota bacterium]